jgi:hypothetical protein
MYVVIVARKPVETQEEGRAIYDLVKQKLAERPDIKVTGQISNHFLDGE